jgi:hypothetical protein
LFKFTKIEGMLFKPYGLEYRMDTFVWRNIYLLVPLLTHYPALIVSRRRRDNPSSIREQKRILQHKATLMEEELLHNHLGVCPKKIS